MAKPSYIYEFSRAGVSLRGTAKELVKQIGGSYGSFLSIMYKKGYKNKKPVYKGYSVKKVYSVVAKTVYKLEQKGVPENVMYGTIEELSRKFGVATSTLYMYISQKTPIRRRGKTFYISAYEVKDVWKPVKSKKK